MSKAVQYYTIFMIPFMLISVFSKAQCDRHGNGNEPRFYLQIMKTASENEKCKRDSIRRYEKLDTLDACELQALNIALANMTKESQMAYIKNLEPFLGKELRTSVLEDRNYDLIFANAEQQLTSYTQLYKLLSKSKFLLDKKMAKGIKHYLHAKDNKYLKASEDTRRGAVLGILTAALGSMDKTNQYQKDAMKSGAFLGAFFAEQSVSKDKISFTKWENITTELYNLPDPYAAIR